MTDIDSIAADNAWYASFKKNEHWVIADEFHVTRRELKSYEERGRQMEQSQEMEPPAPDDARSE